MDFNPGIAASGLFWTTAVPDSSVVVSPGSGRARFALADYATRDFHNIGNALGGGPSDPAIVSFDMRLSKGGRQALQTDGSTFSFRSRINTATVEWTGVNQTTGMQFASDPASTSQSAFAAVGHEKNGTFFG
jgi:hypothetical protein